MDITITLSPDAVVGWQHQLDNVINPARVAENLSPHTIPSFFQEAEEFTGMQHFNIKQKLDRLAGIRQRENVTLKELAIMLQLANRG